MTRVDFHFNATDKLGYACRLVRKIRRTGPRVVVFGDPLTLAEFDRLLWTFSQLDFIPHVHAGDPLAGRTPCGSEYAVAGTRQRRCANDSRQKGLPRT